MKKLWIVLIAMLTAGCSGMGGMQSSGSSGGDKADDLYKPNFASPFDRLDSSFQPYYGD
jgi:hypothetical protein